MRRRPLNHLLMALVATTCALPLAAMAQDKPALKIIVGYPPGGSADTIARLMAEAMRSDFSSVVVENKPGAGGRIALSQVKRAKPDGQTVIITPSGPMVLFPLAYKKLDYDPVADFTPISMLARFQFGVVAGPAATAKSAQDMVSQAKANPGKLTYGTPGLGTLPHFMGVLFEQKVGAPLTHVPFQGGGPANTALLGGHIDYKFDVVSETAELHRASKVRVIAVTGPKRDPQLPDVPTLKEAGFDMEATAWFAMYAPAGLTPEIRDRVVAAAANAIKQPALRERFHSLGLEPVGSNSTELAAIQRAELQSWEKPIKATGVQLD